MSVPTNAEPHFDLSSIRLQQFSDPSFPGEISPAKAGEKFVCFFIADELFGIPAHAVAEVSQLLPLTPLPDAPSWLTGVANLRGELLPVVNLARLLRRKTSPPTSKSKLIVLKPYAHLDSVAFPVDRLAEVITVAPAEVSPPDDFRLFGRTSAPSGDAGLLDIDRIFSSLS